MCPRPARLHHLRRIWDHEDECSSINLVTPLISTEVDLSSSFFIAFTISEDPFNRHREVGPSQDIPTHRFNLNYIYELPFGRGRHFFSNASRLTNLVAGGWSISGIFSFQTGQFLTPLWEGADPVGISYTTSDPADVILRPDILHNANLPGNQRSISNWFDTSAFTDPQPGHFGTSGKGVVIGHGTAADILIMFV